MINWSALLARFISMLMSWMQASNLRNQLYIERNKNEILRTALEDIQRMDAEGRMGWYAKTVLDQVDGKTE
jgi:hypothetical protein